MATRIFLSSDGSRGTKKDTRFYFGAAKGNFTADSLGQLIFQAPPGVSGTVVGGYLYHGENGADGTDPLSNELDIKIDSVSVFTTRPKLDKAAGDGPANTTASGTGITVGVLDADAVAFVAGSLITMDFNITRTTPETEIANVVGALVLELDADVV